MLFTDLNFTICKNGNYKAEIKLDNGYQFDVIKKIKEKVYKIKPFEVIDGRKFYNTDVFPEFSPYPIFGKRELLIDFINTISKHDLEEIPEDNLNELKEEE